MTHGAVTMYVFGNSTYQMIIPGTLQKVLNLDALSCTYEFS